MTLCHACHERRRQVEHKAHVVLGQIMARLTHQPGDQEDLSQFVDGLIRESNRDDDFGPHVVNVHEWAELVELERDWIDQGIKATR